jgi:glycine/D-amino acid oxidase-like deaminating enzyme
MKRVPRIAIVGGGVGGLATALALERRGAEIVVGERSPALNEIGAGLYLSPNCLWRSVSSESKTKSLPSGASQIF